MKTRLDQWLWAARFFKTRSLCQQAIQGGKVHLNQQRAKPSHEIKIHDKLEVTQGNQKKTIVEPFLEGVAFDR